MDIGICLSKAHEMRGVYKYVRERLGYVTERQTFRK